MIKYLHLSATNTFIHMWVLKLSEFRHTIHMSKAKHGNVCSIRPGGYSRMSGSFFIISPDPT